MIHRAAALADLFHPLCGQPGLLLRIVYPVSGNGFFDGLLGVGRLHISDQSGRYGADARDTPLEQLGTRGRFPGLLSLRHG